MHILTTLTYYRPHYSGLTIYTERLARALARRGHEITVLTSRFDPRLSKLEKLDGITVIRIPALMRVSKGLIMPGMPFKAWQLARKADIINLHVPQFDASYLAWIGKMLGKPVVLTYQCDLRLPRGLIHAIANQVSHAANHLAVWGSETIVNTSRDYVEHSDFLKHYLRKVQVINPPVELAAASQQDVDVFKQKFHIQEGQRIIGMAARLATEKGVEYLVRALPGVLKKYPGARVLFVGPYQNVLGEGKYAALLMPQIEAMKDHWSFLDILSPVEMTAFFQTCEVLVVPSSNSTEAFGLVQIEAMTCGTPVVASDMPGVRQPVLSTGMGKLIPVGDTLALEQALMDILSGQLEYQCDTRILAHDYDPDVIASQYEALFEKLIEKSKQRHSVSDTLAD
jgi:glycosyltransferase involved in cell wall biosynthesis